MAAFTKHMTDENHIGMEVIIYEKEKLQGRNCFHHPFHRNKDIYHTHGHVFIFFTTMRPDRELKWVNPAPSKFSFDLMC